jgi:hypothetical protein
MNMRTLGTTYVKKTYEIKIMEIMENKAKTQFKKNILGNILGEQMAHLCRLKK